MLTALLIPFVLFVLLIAIGAAYLFLTRPRNFIGIAMEEHQWEAVRAFSKALTQLR